MPYYDDHFINFIKGKKRWSYKLKVAETNLSQFFSANSEKENTKSLHEASITLTPTPDAAIKRKENYRPTDLINTDENSKNGNNLAR